MVLKCCDEVNGPGIWMVSVENFRHLNNLVISFKLVFPED